MTQAWKETAGSVGARRHCRGATLPIQLPRVVVSRQGAAGRLLTGASALFSVAAPRADPCAGLTGVTDSGGSLGGGGGGVSEDIAAAPCHLSYDNIIFRVK
jgi:hypothetical protein